MKKLNENVAAMNSDEFESNLKRRPIRPIPADWRVEIFHTARAAASAPMATPPLRARISSRLSALFWPCPQAWAGLAAIWLVLAVFNYFAAAPARETMQLAKAPPPSPEVIAAYQKQQRELAQLFEPIDPEAVEPPKPYVPRPRSECKTRILMA
jgi:hypothetical protein